MTGTAFAVANQLTALIALNMPYYVIKGWHSTLLSIGVTTVSILCNTVLVRKLPLLEGLGLVLHVFGFFAFVVVLWVMGPRADAVTTWTKFEDPSGWGNTGLATLVGILGPSLSLGTPDLAVHLAEEVKDAAWVSPRAMVSTSVVNYSLAFVMTVTVFSTMGIDLPTLLNTPLGQPWIQIVLNATGSIIATNILVVVVCLLLMFSAVNQVTASSRQLWSFARDQGLPFSAWLAYVWYSLLLIASKLTCILGPPGMGNPRQFSNVHISDNSDANSYQHRLDHCLQYRHCIRNSWYLHCEHHRHWSDVEKAPCRRISPAFEVRPW